jgi:hypothetical protein
VASGIESEGEVDGWFGGCEIGKSGLDIDKRY